MSFRLWRVLTSIPTSWNNLYLLSRGSQKTSNNFLEWSGYLSQLRLDAEKCCTSCNTRIPRSDSRSAGRKINQKLEKRVLRGRFESENCSAELPKPNPPACYKEKKNLLKICSESLVSSRQRPAGTQRAPSPGRGLQRQLLLGGAWKLITALLQKSSLIWGKTYFNKEQKRVVWVPYQKTT